MFLTLLLKEVRETIATGKFYIATALCLILIPLGMYVTLQDYRQRLSDFHRAEQLYQDRSKGKVRSLFKAEGYRPPSVLSVFAVGLEPFLPNKAVTSDGRYAFRDSMEGMVKISNVSGLYNPLGALFGKMDYLFNVGFVLSVFALLFTFSGISGEKESGTLKLIMSNPVPRWSILASKIAGNYIVFLLPFFVSVLIGFVVLNLSGLFSFSEPGIPTAIAVIIGVTILFLMCMFTFGMFISTRTQHSITSIVTLLFIWVLFVLVIPKLSPMIAQIIKPVESEQVVANRIQILRDDLLKEKWNREDELFVEVMSRHGHTVDDYFAMRDASISDVHEKRKAIEAEYDDLIVPVRNEYADKITQTTMQIKKGYDNAILEQEMLAMQLSRISPVCCFTYILTEISGTGLMEIRNFSTHAQQYQEQVKKSVYDRYAYRQYGTQNAGYNMGFWDIPGVDTKNLPVPHLTGYRHTTAREVMRYQWADIFLLTLYTVLFFTLAFVSFLRYDVR